MPLNLTPDQAIIAVFVGTVLLVLLIGGLVLLGSGDKLKQRRLRRAAGRKPTATQILESQANLRRDRVEGRFKTLERALRQVLPGHQDLRARLARTGYNISLSLYVVISIGVALVCGGGLFLAMPTQPIAAPVAGVVAGYVLPRLVVGLLAGRRMKKFLLELPDAIDVMVRGLKSGLPITEMITTVSNDFEGPVGQEFKAISDGVRFGQTIDEALWSVAARLDIPEFNFLAISIGVQRETGGNLTETLRNLSSLLRQRQQMRLKVRALSSEARASAYIIGVLPFAMAGIIYVVNPEYIGRLFEEPTGHMMLAGALISEMLGAAVMIKMVKFEI